MISCLSIATVDPFVDRAPYGIRCHSCVSIVTVGYLSTEHRTCVSVVTVGHLSTEHHTCVSIVTVGPFVNRAPYMCQYSDCWSICQQSTIHVSV